jgi:hypothetical protein
MTPNGFDPLALSRAVALKFVSVSVNSFANFLANDAGGNAVDAGLCVISVRVSNSRLRLMSRIHFRILAPYTALGRALYGFSLIRYGKSKRLIGGKFEDGEIKTEERL